MTRTIGIGVIGMGWMGQVHSRSYALVPQRFPDAQAQARLIICSDNVAERARDGAARLGFAAHTTDWREVIAHSDVEAVNITTPNALHLEIVEAAAAAGKHIFCEKPVGRTPAETAAIARIARAAGVLTYVGFNYRAVPLVRHARQLVTDGRLGTLQHWRGRFFSMYGSNPMGLSSWRFDSDVAGYGVMGDILSHVTDMSLFMVGQPVRRVVSNRHTFIAERPLPVPGAGTHYSVGKPGDPTRPVTNEDYIGVLVEFDGDVFGTLEVSRTIFGPKNQFAFELNGTRGALSWDFERMNELQLYLPTDDGLHDGFIRLVGGDQYPYHGNFNPGEGTGIGYEDLKIIEAYGWLNALGSGQPVAPTFEDALAVAAVHDAVIRSWESGTWETVQPL